MSKLIAIVDDTKNFFEPPSGWERYVIFRSVEAFYKVHSIYTAVLLYDELWLDHDMGERNKTGMTILEDIERGVIETPRLFRKLPHIRIVSMNPPARQVMQKVAKKLNARKEWKNT